MIRKLEKAGLPGSCSMNFLYLQGDGRYVRRRVKKARNDTGWSVGGTTTLPGDPVAGAGSDLELPHDLVETHGCCRQLSQIPGTGRHPLGTLGFRTGHHFNIVCDFLAGL